MTEKAEVRQTMRRLKRELDATEKAQRSAAIMQQVESLNAFAQAKVVLLYWSMADEVQTHAFVERWHTRKTVLLPCVDGDTLRLRQYTGAACMVAGEQYGIGEPAGEEWTALDQVEAVVVPGVAFDRHGNRMGRGRGFYDRLLLALPQAVKIGVAFGFQVLDSIPVEAQDVPMDLVVND